MKHMKKNKKENFWVPLGTNMYDCCYCMSKNCACPCGRKPSASNKKERELERYITMSDFTPVCSHYVPIKIVYKLTRELPIVDPIRPQEINRGMIIDKEIEITNDDFAILLDALWGQTKGIEKECEKLANKIAWILKENKKCQNQ